MTNGNLMLSTINRKELRNRYVGIQDRDVMIDVHEKLRCLPDRLRSLRKASGFTLKDVADMTGFTSEAVRKMESGQLTPSVVGLLIMAEFYGVGLDWLFGGDELYGNG